MSRVEPLADSRILVVEDEYLIAIALKKWLTEAGADVVGPAPDVERALALVEAERLDAAILDVSLGGTKSFPVADALSQRRVPFIFTTGYDITFLPDRYAHVVICEKPFGAAAVTGALVKATADMKGGR